MGATKKIIFTGGSSGGHVAANVPLIEAFKTRGWKTHCVILGNHIEHTLLAPTNAVFHTVTVGKLRRYFDIKNFTDIFRTIRGLQQAMHIVRTVRPQAVFSKGGSLAVPMAFAAWMYDVPFFVHESDAIPSLTTMLTAPFARIVFSGFPADEAHTWKSIIGMRICPHAVGIPLREVFRNAPRKPRHKGRQTLLVTGGSLGATSINHAVRAALPLLIRDFDVIHICGTGKTDASISNSTAYRQYEFVDTAQMYDHVSNADVVVTRGSATTLYEVIALHKPMLIIPLSFKASRGDQIANAAFFKTKGLGEVLAEEDISPENLLARINRIKENYAVYKETIDSYNLPDSVALIAKEIEDVLRSS